MWNDTNKGKPKYQETNCPIVTVSPINPTQIGLISKLGSPGDRPTTKCLTHGKDSRAILVM